MTTFEKRDKVIKLVFLLLMVPVVFITLLAAVGSAWPGSNSYGPSKTYTVTIQEVK